jgi:HEAT repeat protein
MKPNTMITSKRILALGAMVLVVFFALHSFAAAQARTEQRLLEVLKSNASLQEKDAACAELKRVGTAQAVQVLAGLLTDADLSHAARYALESLPAPEAGLALIGALDKTSGLIKAGIIHSIGQRRETRAAHALGPLIADPDVMIAAAAATAVGRIGGAEAIRALQNALSKTVPPAPRSAIIDALLMAADQELAAGRKDAASTVFERLRKLPVPDHVRTAAYRGMIDAAGPGRDVALVRKALAGADGAEQIAALEMAPRLKDPETTRVLCAAAVRAAAPLKVALIEALRERGDTAAAPTLVAMAKSPDETVRLAALTGLGELGDATSVPLLLEAAASNSESEARISRQALLILNDGHLLRVPMPPLEAMRPRETVKRIGEMLEEEKTAGDITRALAAQLTTGEDAGRVEAARALAGRGDRSASASLIAAARVNPDPVLGALLKALGQLAGPSDIPALVGLVVEAKSDTARDEAKDALGAACTRLQSRGILVDAAPIADGLAAAAPPARGALLEAGSVLAADRLRAALRRSLSDPVKDVRDPAVRALCQTRDSGLLPDLLDLAARSTTPDERVLAVRGYVRLVNDTDNTPLGPAERVKALTAILPLARPEEKWLLLAGLAKWPDVGALALALGMLDEPATRVEAMGAATQIATGLASSHREHARMALEKVLAAASEPNQREAALSALKQLDPAFGTGSSVKFRRIKVDGRFRSEGVAVADFNRDGKLDIATGNILYLGPDWKPQPMKAEAKEYQPESYSDEFLCFAEDIDRDGWSDLVVVGFPGAKTRWLRNPARSSGAWPEFPAIEKTGNESPEWTDVDKDGRRELVFVSENGLALARPGADPKKPWPIRVIAGPQDPRPGHGLGVGDINGDGRLDIVCPDGWWEGPSGPARAPWAFHPAPLAPQPPAQMPVLDVNGDGRADVLSSGAHRYGLWWTEQTADGWRPHEIDHSISQLHALHLADINGDGLPDLVTGKRFWAHREGDEGIDDPAVLCWFEMKREGGKPAWIRHDIDSDSGVGLHVQIIDIDGDGLLDIVTSNKKGVYMFLQERKSQTSSGGHRTMKIILLKAHI